MLSKKASAIIRLRNRIDQLMCPVCQDQVEINDQGTLSCPNNHCFDVSKKGYLNVLRQAPKENYHKSLFESRQRVIQGGLYGPLIDYLYNFLQKTFGDQSLSLIDAGCGEGSHLSGLRSRFDGPMNFYGVDIAKAGIGLATDSKEDISWLVGDLAQVPLRDATLDVVLNILSPGHYETFKRLLKDQGLVIKVIPRPDYLKEIRQAFYPDQPYSNEPVKDHFLDHFDLVDQGDLHYVFPLPEDLKMDLLKMTPLTWQFEDKQLEALDLKEVTVSLLVMVGKCKN